jgi:hypothetical protein
MYIILPFLTVVACFGFAFGFELLAFPALFFLTLLSALEFPKQLFFLLIVSMPISLELIHSPKDLLSGLTGGVNANGLLVLLLVGAALPAVLFKALKAGWRPSKSLLFLTAYIIWSGLTILYSAHPLVGARYIGYLVYPLVYLVFVQYLTATEGVSEGRIFKWMLVSAAAAAVVGYLLFAFGFHFISIQKEEFVFGTDIKRFSNPLGYGSSHWALGMVLYALIAADAMTREDKNKIFTISALVICSASMVLTYTRIPFAILVLLLLVMTISRRKFVSTAVVCVLAAVILFLTPMGLRFQFFGSAVKDIDRAEAVIDESKKEMEERRRLGLEEPDDSGEPTRLDDRRLLFQTALSGREILLKTSFNLAMNSPPWGYGAGTADYKLNSFFKDEMGITAPVINTHSVILRSRIETGFLGTGLLSAFLIALFVEIVRSRKRGNRYFILGILVYFYFCLALLLEPLLSWYRFAGSIFFIIFAIAAADKGRTDRQQTGDCDNPPAQ